MFDKILVSTVTIVCFGLVLSAPKPQDLYESKANPYEFGFKISDQHGNKQHRQESGDAEGNKKGSYGYEDAYGLYRNVEYVANGYGFKAYINSNEPGVGNQDPADVKIEKSGSAPDIVRKAVPVPKRVSKPVKAGPSYKARRVVAPKHRRPAPQIKHPAPVHRRPAPAHRGPAPHPKRTLIHADPSYTLKVAQLPDLHAPILRKRKPAPRVPKPQIIHKVAPPPHPVAALIKDDLQVGYKEPQDLYKIPPHQNVDAHPGSEHGPTPHPDAPYDGPKTTLKTFTEKPAQKPEYRPRFASKANADY